MSKIATPNQRKAKLCANDASITDNTSNSYKTFCCSFDAIPDGNVGFVTAGCTFAAHFERQKGSFRPRAVRFSSENIKKKSPKNGLFKPFFGLLSLAGAEGLEPSARGFGVATETFSVFLRI